MATAVEEIGRVFKIDPVVLAKAPDTMLTVTGSSANRDMVITGPLGEATTVWRSLAESYPEAVTRVIELYAALDNKPQAPEAA